MAKTEEIVQKARKLRNNMTLAEKILWSRLRSRKINGYKFRRQQPIFNYIVDFYCPELKFIIEVDGEIHELQEKINYDKKRDSALILNGYKILHFANSEIISDIGLTVNKIALFIAQLKSDKYY